MPLQLPVTVHIVAGDRYSDPSHWYLDQGGSLQVPGAVFHLQARSPLCTDWRGCRDRAGRVSGMLLHHQGTFLPALHGKATQAAVVIMNTGRVRVGRGVNIPLFELWCCTNTERFMLSGNNFLFIVAHPTRNCIPSSKVVPNTDCGQFDLGS